MTFLRTRLGVTGLGITSSVQLLIQSYGLYRTNNCGLNHLGKVIPILKLYLLHFYIATLIIKK